MRCTLAVLVGLFLAPQIAHAGGEKLAGNWRLSFVFNGQQRAFWILRLETKAGKLDGVLSTAKKMPSSTLHDLRREQQEIRFTIKIADDILDFVCRVPKDGAEKAYGHMTAVGKIFPALLELSKEQTLDEPFIGPQIEFRFEKTKEDLAKHAEDARVFEAALKLLGTASAKKARAEEVGTWARTVLKSAELYGTLWSKEMTFRLAEKLTTQPGHEAVAEEIARQAFALVGPKEPAAAQIRGLDVLVNALRNAGKKDELAKLQRRLDELEVSGYHEYEKTSLPFKPEAFGGRKKDSKRVVLVELFTGAQCPPCVAADLAFDGLEKTYKTADVVLLQYHLHIPGADALTNYDSEMRKDYYGDELRGTPTIFFNGEAKAPGGGGRQQADGKYRAYREVIESLLEQPADVRLATTVARNGDTIQIAASVSGLKKAGDKMRLRFALVEGWVRYQGSNGLSHHHRVVRYMPGGVDGIALTKQQSEHKATVNLEELRRHLTKYHDTMNVIRPFLDSQRPLRFRDLHVVAFVQNDETREVLQASEVPVK